MPPQDTHTGQAKGRPHLVGVGLDAETEFKTSDGGARENGFDVHMNLTGKKS
jgi:hypothetical protein